MKRFMLLALSLVISAPAWADRVASGGQTQAVASSGAQVGTCVLGADHLYKIMTPAGEDMKVVPSLSEALKNKSCPKLRDYSDVVVAYSKVKISGVYGNRTLSIPLNGKVKYIKSAWDGWLKTGVLYAYTGVKDSRGREEYARISCEAGVMRVFIVSGEGTDAVTDPLTIHVGKMASRAPKGCNSNGEFVKKLGTEIASHKKSVLIYGPTGFTHGPASLKLQAVD